MRKQHPPPSICPFPAAVCCWDTSTIHTTTTGIGADLRTHPNCLLHLHPCHSIPLALSCTTPLTAPRKVTPLCKPPLFDRGVSAYATSGPHAPLQHAARQETTMHASMGHCTGGPFHRPIPPHGTAEPWQAAPCSAGIEHEPAYARPTPLSGSPRGGGNLSACDARMASYTCLSYPFLATLTIGPGTIPPSHPGRLRDRPPPATGCTSAAPRAACAYRAPAPGRLVPGHYGTHLAMCCACTTIVIIGVPKHAPLCAHHPPYQDQKPPKGIGTLSTLLQTSNPTLAPTTQDHHPWLPRICLQGNKLHPKARVIYPHPTQGIHTLAKETQASTPAPWIP
jgi:hypothetical protein